MVRPIMKAVLRKDYLAITGDYREAMVFNQFMYWAEKVNKSDELLKVENEKRRRSGVKEVEPRDGWFYKSAKDMAEELMMGISSSQMSRYIKSLVTKGLLITRRNPRHKWDRTLQYKVNLDAVKAALKEAGYELSDYTERDENVDLSHIAPTQHDVASMQHGECAEATAITEIISETPYTDDLQGLYKSSPPLVAHDDGIFEKYVRSFCRESGERYDQKTVDIINLFVHKFEDRYKQPHGRIPKKQLGNVYRAIRDGFSTRFNEIDYFGVDDYDDMIDVYFNNDSYMSAKGKTCDHRIYHFLTEGVREILFERMR